MSIVAWSKTVAACQLPPFAKDSGKPSGTIPAPPATTRAPFPTASATCAATLSTAARLIKGPSCVSAAAPSPARNAFAFCATSAANSSATDSCTNARLTQMHVCPALRRAEATTPRAASSRSASGKTKKGALPPSSRERRLAVAAAWAAKRLPTWVEPVKPSLRTVSEVVRIVPVLLVLCVWCWGCVCFVCL
jgi:hypothetical protein